MKHYANINKIIVQVDKRTIWQTLWLGIKIAAIQLPMILLSILHSLIFVGISYFIFRCGLW